jgi:hypothetical protein
MIRKIFFCLFVLGLFLFMLDIDGSEMFINEDCQWGLDQIIQTLFMLVRIRFSQTGRRRSSRYLPASDAGADAAAADA